MPDNTFTTPRGPIAARLATRTGQVALRWLLFAAILAFLLAFLVWPLLHTVRGGFQTPEGEFTFRYFREVFENPLWVEGLVNSLMIAIFTTIGALLLALPLGMLAAWYKFPGKTLLTSAVLVPLILPPFVGAIGLRSLLGRAGAINALLIDWGMLPVNHPGIDFLGGVWEGGQFWGVVLMEALHLYPIMYLNISAALANLDPAYEEAATGLGASRMRQFFKITLPLILPGIFAGATIVFIWSFTELGTPLMFDYYNVTPVQIFWGIQEVQTNPRPYALVVVMLIVAVTCYLLGKAAFGGRAYAMQSKASIAAQTKKLGALGSAAAIAAFVLVTFIAILPHIGVVFSSFSVEGAWYRTVLPSQYTLNHYDDALGHDMAMTSIANSLKYALCAVVITVVVGIAIAYLAVRVKMPGSGLLDSLGMLPLAVPGLVMAFGYVSMTVSWPLNGWPFAGEGAPFENWFNILGKDANPFLLLVIAYAIRRLPYVLRSVAAGLEQTSGELEEAAFNLGASTMTTIRKIVVPLIMANIIAGAILAFSFAMLEVSDSLVLAQREEHYPITKAIFEFYGRLGDGPYIASAMGVWGMALLTVTLVGASMMMGKKLGAIFRV